MRKMVVLLVMVLIFGVIMVVTASAADDEKTDGDLYLTLVNKYHRLPADWTERIELEKAQNFEGEEFLVEKVTLEHFNALRDELLDLGIDIELDSTYRDVNGQIDVWEWFRNEGYTDEYCFSHLAVPGFSEHHTGLAIDIGIIKDGVFINDNDEMIAEKEIFGEIHKHLAEHGFILRYLPGMDEITGYAYEPWHFRYVGVENARLITESGLTLEEYLGELPA